MDWVLLGLRGQYHAHWATKKSSTRPKTAKWLERTFRSGGLCKTGEGREENAEFVLVMLHETAGKAILAFIAS